MTPVDRDTSAEILRNRKACDLCLKEKCNKKCKHVKNYTYQQIERAYDEAIAYIENRPSADVAEVKHGEWVYNVKYYSCSICAGKRFNLLLGTDAEFCPYCGAKMDKENAQ